MNKYLIEFIGSLFITYIIIKARSALAVGASLAIAMMVGAESGAHFNPAVSIVATRTGRLAMTDLVPYILAQVAGSLTALEIVRKFM